MIEEGKDQIVDLLGCQRERIILASAKQGLGIDIILQAIVERIAAPVGNPDAPLQAMIFDSVYNTFRGIEVCFKIRNGTIRKGDQVKFIRTEKTYTIDEVGVLGLQKIPQDVLSAGHVGYLISGIKDAREVKVGDTITHVMRPCSEAIQGFSDVKPMVFAGIYPVETAAYEDLRASIEKLQLNDAALVWEPETSVALGFGFRCGFLGMLHMEIIQERLEREFGMTVITTVPSVQFQVFDKQGNVKEVHAPSEMPAPGTIDQIQEPFCYWSKGKPVPVVT